MTAQTRTNTIRSLRRGGAAFLALLLLALAGRAAAESPWTNISGMIATRRNAALSAMTTATAPSATPAVPVMNAPALPPLAEAAPGAPATSTALAMRMNSASTALAALGATTATAAATATADAKSGGDAKTLDLGRESDENEPLLATNLFKRPEILQLLGDAPRFIYNPLERPDPMVVPWVRRAAIYKELSALAEKMTADKKFDEAVVLYQRILALNDERYNGIARAKLVAIAELQNASALAALNATRATEPPVVLPAWVQDNTTGVIISRERDMCLVGNYMLHVGDSVPDYPDVKVATIAQSKVVYKIKNKSFEVSLKTN